MKQLNLESISNAITAKRGSVTLKKIAHNDSFQQNQEASDSQRIIIVSHSYAPMLNPRAYRWTALAERWAQQGKQVDVICSWESGLQQSEVVNQVNIHRVGAGLVENLRAKLRSENRNTRAIKEITTSVSNTRTGFAAKVKQFLSSVLRIAHDLTWKNLYWPDSAALWAKPATKQVNALLNSDSETGNTTLITVSDPFTSHVAGKSIKQKWPTLNWIVDIGDPFCFRSDTPTNNHAIFNSLNYRYEREVFAEADSISVTTEATKDKYAELFPESKNKITIIAPLVTFESVSDTNQPLGENSSLKALYTGALYRAIRNPEYLLKLFSAVAAVNPNKKMELHFFGSTDDCKSMFQTYQEILGSRLHLHGLMPKETTLAALNQADLLINIGNTNPYQLPSKVVEYACTDKPILNIASIENDSSAEFFDTRPNTLKINSAEQTSFENHVEQLSEFMNSQNESIPKSYRVNLKSEHSIKRIGEQYSALLVKQTEMVAAQ